MVRPRGYTHIQGPEVNTHTVVSQKVRIFSFASDMEEKVIDVDFNEGQNYKIGSQVTVEMKQSQGTWAVLLGYVFPFLVILISMILLSYLNLDEGLTGVISLSLLIPYYAILYFSKDFLKKNFTYRIRG